MLNHMNLLQMDSNHGVETSDYVDLLELDLFFFFILGLVKKVRKSGNFNVY